jgi:hypothetical protein
MNPFVSLELSVANQFGVHDNLRACRSSGQRPKKFRAAIITMRLIEVELIKRLVPMFDYAQSL